ncbi:MAG: GNAT family N-acetyltransferase [Cyanobacteriota bacterium]
MMGAIVKTTSMTLPRELRIVVEGPIGPQRLHDDTVVIESDGWYRTLTPSCAWPSANEVLFSDLDSVNPDKEIDRIIAEYHGHGLPITWCVYPWTQPCDLGKRLLIRGATKSPVKAMLISSSLQLEVVEGVQVDRVDPDSEDSFEAYMRVLNFGYQLLPAEEAFRRRRYREMIRGANPSMILFLGRYKGQVAGCAGMVIKDDSAHITTSSVLREYQARGVFLSLNATIVQTMRELGIAIASGHANINSAPWVEHFGGKVVYSYDIYQLDPPSHT